MAVTQLDLRRLLLASAVVILALPGSASALTWSTRAGPYLPGSGPRLGGDAVVWADGTSRGGYRVFLARRGGKTRTVADVDRPPGGLSYAIRIAASADRVAVQQGTVSRTAGPGTSPTTTPLEVLSGPLSGGLSQLARRSSDSPPERDIDVDGQVVVYPAPDASDAARVTDFGAPGSPTTRIVSPVGSGLRLAGRYLASIVSSDVVVRDWTTGAELYRVTGVAPSGGGDIDLQSDGKVAFTLGGGVAWASPQAPFPHRLPVPPRGPAAVRISGDRVVFVRSVAGDPPVPTGELLSSDLQGHVRVLARPVIPGTFEDYFDFDGRQVAWAERGCTGVTIRVQDEADRSRLPKSERCRLRLTRRPRLHRRGLVTLTADCRGLVPRCLVRGISVRTTRRYHVNGATIPAHTRINGGWHVRGPAVRVYLSAVGRRLSRGHRRLPIELVARLAEGSSQTGARKTGKFTIR